MLLHNLLIRLKLRYKDNSQEQEYLGINIPLLKDFLFVFLICMAITTIPFSIHFFSVNLSAQAYTAIGFLVFLVLIFAGKAHLGPWLEYIVILYLLGLVITIIINLSKVLATMGSCEAFYLGYTFALLNRVLGYRVVKVHFMILFHIISLVIRLIYLSNHNLPISLIVTAVEILTVCICVKSEHGERGFFDSLYKSKMQLVKFRDFLTEHLPNPMVLFKRDYSEALLMNEAFKQYFNCKNISQAKSVMNSLFIEKDSIDKDFSGSFSHIVSPKEQLSFSKFLSLFASSFSQLRSSEILTFHIFEGEKENISRNSLGEDQTLFDRIQTRSPTKSFRRNERLSYLMSRKNSQSILANQIEFTDMSKPDPFHEHNKTEFLEPKTVEEDRKRIFEVKMFLIPWDQTDAIALVLNDITQQRTIMELRVADKNKDLVIATISHELRTPLNGILGMIDIVKKKVEDSEVMSYLNAVRNNGLFLLNTVNSTLDMSQIKNNKLKLVYEEVDVGGLMNELCSLFESFCNEKGLYLNIEISEDVPKTLVTDRNRLNQILINLLGNAFKFTFQGGVTVQIDFEKKCSNSVTFSVQDTGVGIDKEDQKNLFKMFGRLEQQDRKVNTSGVGLGLTISNTLAILLNPSEKQGIQLESEVGRGSMFSFTIEPQQKEMLFEGEGDSFCQAEEHNLEVSHNEDCARIEPKQNPYITDQALNFDIMRSSKRSFTQYEPSNLLARRSTRAKKGSLAGWPNTIIVDKRRSTDPFRKETRNLSEKSDCTVSELIPERQLPEHERPWCLLVDDNPFNLMVARHIMEERGYNIKTAMNGAEAVQEAEEHYQGGKTFKVILMDCQMPVMDGYEATKALTEMMAKGEIGQCPVFALTANIRDENHEERWKESGMSGSIGKPLQIMELERMLKKV